MQMLDSAVTQPRPQQTSAHRIASAKKVTTSLVRMKGGRLQHGFLKNRLEDKY